MNHMPELKNDGAQCLQHLYIYIQNSRFPNKLHDVMMLHFMLHKLHPRSIQPIQRRHSSHCSISARCIGGWPRCLSLSLDAVKWFTFSFDIVHNTFYIVLLCSLYFDLHWVHKTPIMFKRIVETYTACI